MMQLVEAEPSSDGEARPQHEELRAVRIGDRRREQCPHTRSDTETGEASNGRRVVSLQGDFAERDRNELPISTDRSGGFVGPAFDRIVDASSEGP